MGGNRGSVGRQTFTQYRTENSSPEMSQERSSTAQPHPMNLFQARNCLEFYLDFLRLSLFFELTFYLKNNLRKSPKITSSLPKITSKNSLRK